jgi:hypothetical protein
MNTPRILALSVASLLTVTFAQAQTWDGGGTSNLFTNAANWNPDGVPGTTADIIFAGIVRLTPENTTSFQVNSVVFNNTAGAFVIGGTGTLSIKGGGLTSNDASTQTFNNPVSFGLAAASTINATSGALVLNGAVTTATTTLTLNGGNAITFGSSIAGTGAITKAGAGAFNFDATASSIGADFNLNAGVTTLTVGSTQTFSSGSSMNVTGTASLVFNESVILAGAQITRATGAGLTVAAGKTLTVQNGGDVEITGSFSSSSASTILVSGAGSTFSSSSSLDFTGGSVVGVSLGGSLSSLSTAFIGTGGNGTVTVDGVGSDFSAPALFLGLGGGTVSLTFSNGSTGTLGGVTIDAGSVVGTNGTLNIQSGAVVNATSLTIAPNTAANTGTMTITGGSSSLVVNGAGGTTIGATSLSTGTLNVQSGGTFTSGTGTTTVNATGTVAITGGTFNQNGNMTVNGRLTRDAGGAFNLAAGKTLTVQNGGDVDIGGSFGSSSSTLLVTGAGSTFSTRFFLVFEGGSVANVSLGGSLSTGNRTFIGTDGTGNGTVTVDGGGSNFSSLALTLGAGSLTFSNGSTGTLGGVAIVFSSSGGSNGTLNVQSGAVVNATSLGIAHIAEANTGTMTITGAGSSLVVSGAGGTDIGAGSASTGTLNVQSGSTFTSGTGTTTVDATGTIAITGGTFNQNGHMTVSGRLTRNAFGDFNFAADKTLNVQNGGDVEIIGSVNLPTGSANITGVGSTFTVSNVFAASGFNLSVFDGGSFLAGAVVLEGSPITPSFVNVQGSGSTFVTGAFLLGNGVMFCATGSTSRLDSVSLNPGDFGLSAVESSMIVSSGAQVTAGATRIGTSSGGSNNHSTLTVTGIGSSYTPSSAGALNLEIGFNGLGTNTGTLNVQNGGTYTSSTGGSVLLNSNGTINIDGGILNLAGPLIRNGGVLNFNTGALSIVDAFNVGTGGLFGTNVTFDTTRQFATSGTTTIEAFRTLTLNGGGFSTGTLINNGTLAFNSGTLAITGASGLNIGTGGLGSIVTLGSGSNLQVTNIATVASGASLTLNGGTFSAGLLSNSGTVRVNLGTAAVVAVNNNSGGRLFVGDMLGASGSWTNAAGATLTLENNGLVNGLGALSNSGLVTGTGSIATPFTNASGGEVRGELGKTLTFTGASGSNAGRINLLGGTVQFTQPLTNGATGQINGAGVIAFPTAPVPSSGSAVAGLNNSGRLNFSGGDTQVYGTVQMLAGSRLIASGGATATFYDVFRHNGAEVKASAGSSLVFFGEVRGAGSFTGTGTIYMEGGYSPGNSPASVALNTDLVLGNAGTLTLELGGLIAGTSYDQLVLGAGGSLALGGTLLLDLINDFSPVAGDSFQVLDFTLGQLTGGFDEIRLADPLSAGLSFDTTQLTTTGRIGVVPEPGIAALLLTGGAFLGLRRRNRK